MKRFLITAAAAIGISTLATAADVGEVVRLAPAPGVTVDVPKGWIACDDTTNALLGHSADPQGLKKLVCSPPAGVSFKLRVFDPRLFRTISVMFDQHKDQDISSTDLDAITPEVATAITPKVCPEVTKPLLGDGTTIESCNVSVGMLAGHKALVSTVVAIPPGDPSGKYQLSIYELPYPEGYLQVQFNTPQLYLPTTRPVMEQILASITIE